MEFTYIVKIHIRGFSLVLYYLKMHWRGLSLYNTDPMKQSVSSAL